MVINDYDDALKADTYLSTGLQQTRRNLPDKRTTNKQVDAMNAITKRHAQRSLL